MISIHSLTYILGDTPFFKNVSAEFDSGKLHTIAGKNGVGKSTLLHTLHGDRTVESGSIIIDDVAYMLTNSGSIDALKKMIGFVPQSAGAVLVPELTVAENLQLATLSNVSLLSPLPAIDTTLIRSFHIDPAQRAERLSGGQKHILAIAMILQQKRSVLLLDEPVAALDDENAALVLSFLEQLVQEGMTIIVVTHDPIKVTVPVQQWELIKQADGTRTLK